MPALSQEHSHGVFLPEATQTHTHKKKQRLSHGQGKWYSTVFNESGQNIIQNIKRERLISLVFFFLDDNSYQKKISANIRASSNLFIIKHYHPNKSITWKKKTYFTHKVNFIFLV